MLRFMPRIFVFLLCSLFVSSPVQAKGDIKLPEKMTQMAGQGDAQAQTILGMLYFSNRNYAQAAQWYGKASEQGNADAQNFLALMYLQGQGVPQNTETAIKLYHKAAEQGSVNAQSLLGEIYYKGKVVKRNHKEALKWNRIAAEHANPEAQSNLGMMYLLGDGVQQNITQGYAWLSAAASHGSKATKKLRSNISRSLTSEEKEKAKVLYKKYYKLYVDPFQEKAP